MPSLLFYFKATKVINRVPHCLTVRQNNRKWCEIPAFLYKKTDEKRSVLTVFRAKNTVFGCFLKLKSAILSPIVGK